MSGDIADFYRRYPYPLVDQVEYDRNLHDHLRYLSHACYDNPAPRGGPRRGRMLIAGCGTREAVLWGASLPHFDIHAVDLSEASIAISKALCQQLGVTNVDFRRGDFERGEGLDGPYDFISSFGVLHHLESPARGLAQLEAHLAPGGLMALMVYSDTNRFALQRGQRVIDLLTRGADGPQREAAAVSVCITAAVAPSRLRHVFLNAIDDHLNNREQFADTMLNPREVSYTIPGFADLLATSGLELVSPVQPMDWDVGELLSQARHQTLGTLPLQQRLEVADYLTGPLFWFGVRRRSERATTRPCATDHALFWQIVPRPMDTGYWTVDELVVSSDPVVIEPGMKALAGGDVAIWRREDWPRTFGRVAWRIVQATNGQRTLLELAEGACDEEGVDFAQVADTLRDHLHTLIDEQGLATPDASRCSGCPLRDP